MLPKYNWAVLQSFPVWEDSIVVLYTYLLETNISRIIWLVPEIPTHYPFDIELSKTMIVKRKSIKGFFYFSLSKYVFLTHGIYFRVFPKNQISVNIWHGMPLKRIGLLNGGPPLKTSYALSTSNFFAEVIKNSFGIPLESVLPIGLPRNEVLFCERELVRERLNIRNDLRIVIWVPTYRKSIVGEIRHDGGNYDNPFNVSDFDHIKINDFFKDRKVLCLFKSHPMADMGNHKSSSNLWIIDDDFLYSHALTLYQILNISVLLITDISSIVVDYLLLERPIVFSFADRNAYLKNRGLNSSEILNTSPGKICNSQRDILEEVDAILNGYDLYKGNREFLKELYHGKTDFMNCSNNLLKAVGLY